MPDLPASAARLRRQIWPTAHGAADGMLPSPVFFAQVSPDFIRPRRCGRRGHLNDHVLTYPACVDIMTRRRGTDMPINRNKANITKWANFRLIALGTQTCWAQADPDHWPFRC
jgi:hypothetical protein